MKLKRILVYPNITYQKDIHKDSYIQVIHSMITELNEIRSDLYFYLILPTYLSYLDFPNTHQYLTSFNTLPQAMRCEFDVDAFKLMIPNKIDIDMVFSHLPEHTTSIINTMYNLTHHTPPIFGYCHWFDLPGTKSLKTNHFRQNICGILEMDRCYINTESQKTMVIKEASKTFNTDIFKRLNDILVVQHPGINKDDIARRIDTNTDKIIVFNHRPHAYKDFSNILNVLRTLHRQRQDFSVWIPLLDTPFANWITTEKLSKQDYYAKLSTCRVGISPKQKYGGWSVSTTDGLMNGCPYVMYDADYYKELYPDADTFSNNNTLIDLLNLYLDDNQYRNDKAYDAISHSYNLIYHNQMIEMSSYIDDLYERIPIIDSYTSYMIAGEIKKNGSISKEDLMKKLGWGRGFKFTGYRKYLMSHPNIFDDGGVNPLYVWKSSR